MRHAFDHAATGSACGDPESRHARRSQLVRQSADGDLHDRQASLPSNTGGAADVRAAAEAVSKRLVVLANAGTQLPMSVVAEGLCYIVQFDRPQRMGPGVPAFAKAPAN